MTLQQHLGDACRSAEIAVNLERRVSIEEVRIGAAVGILSCSIVAGQQLQHVFQNGEGMIAVKHTCPEADFPAEAPARGSIAAVGQCLLGSGEEFVMAVRRNLVRGEQTVEVGDMAMFLFAAISIDKPFLQLLAAANLHRRHFGEGFTHFGDGLRVFGAL